MSDEDRVALARLEERVENWMESTIEYRQSLCQKMERIFGKLDELPCRERLAYYRGLQNVIKMLWGAVGLVFGLLVAHMGWK